MSPVRLESLAGPFRSVLLLVASAGLAGCGSETAVEAERAYLGVEPGYSGAAACAECHRSAYDAWIGSHHDLAMQEATSDTVLGDFDDATFDHFGVRTTFSRRGEEFWVRTEGADGELADFRIDYVFGIDPLQQYLIGFPDGRYQALSVSWDARPAAEGGQRWFHLYPEERIRPDDPLHWTGIDQNWNYMCAECHSTDLRKGYDRSSDTYSTTWEEIDVACEACHGPGTRHIAWARERAAADDGSPPEGDLGLVVRLEELDDPAWSYDEQGIARRQPRRTSGTQVETCGRCHSRRGVIRDGYTFGEPLLDSHRVSLLEPGLYHPDGQILGEVYVYGSFLESRMYAEGVTCSDCHDPHSLELWNEGNAVCARCHLPAKYDSREHHHHAEGTPAARCVACHMRSETYMVVDPRRDHSFRVPRPDLSLRLGTPNACTDCHRETSPEWAAERFAEWYPKRVEATHFGQALWAGREALPEAGTDLVALINDVSQPGIVRATALELLGERFDPSLSVTLSRGAKDPDPLVRMAAATALQSADPATALGIGRALLEDPVLAVRVAAANSLVSLPAGAAPPEDLEPLRAAVEDLRRAQLVNADRPESLTVLGSLHARAGELAQARTEYERALEIEPAFVPAIVNLADLYRQSGEEAAAEGALREALAIEPDNADVHHALGLTLVRQQRIEDALKELARAAELAPTNLRYGYVYAVAAQSTGRIPLALKLLEGLHDRWPTNRDVLVALASYYAQMGGFAEAESYAEKLVELSPQDPQARAMLDQIRSRN